MRDARSPLSRMIQSLEAKGLVLKEVSPDDGRVSMIPLTPEGSQIVQELMQTVADVINQILQPDGDSEKQQRKSLLQRAI